MTETKGESVIVGHDMAGRGLFDAKWTSCTRCPPFPENDRATKRPQGDHPRASMRGANSSDNRTSSLWSWSRDRTCRQLLMPSARWGAEEVDDGDDWLRTVGFDAVGWPPCTNRNLKQ